MKKLTLIIAVVAMGFIMASCGNKEKELMQKATEFYTQNETELKAVNNLNDFVNFFQNFEQKLNEFKGTFSDMQLSENTKKFLSEKENAFNELKSQKAGELFTTYLEPFEEFVNMYNEFETEAKSGVIDGTPEEHLAKMESLHQETKAKVEKWKSDFEEWNLDKNILHDVLEKNLPAETTERMNKIQEVMDKIAAEETAQ